jgi:hypothetical protein
VEAANDGHAEATIECVGARRTLRSLGRVRTKPNAQGAIAGDAILHPFVLVAIAAFIVNDHVAKALWPGLLTGKISDVAGLIFFPVLVMSLWEVGLEALGRFRGPDQGPLIRASIATVVAFALIKSTPEGASVWAWLLEVGQWLVRLPWAFLTDAVGPPARVLATQDPTDLIAVPAVLMAVWLGGMRSAAGKWLANAGSTFEVG